MFNRVYLFLLLVCGLTVNCGKSKNEEEINQPAIVDVIIKKILNELRPHLEHLRINRTNFETGPQEFGTFEGYVDDVHIEGLEKFKISRLDTSVLDVKNLTILMEQFNIEGQYGVNGTLIFPLGKNDINFFGEGKMSMEFANFSISFMVKIRSEGDKNVVKDLDIDFNLEKMKVSLRNLMGGGDLEIVFNQMINDVVLTVFYYYKKPVLDYIIPVVKEMILKILNPKETLVNDEL